MKNKCSECEAENMMKVADLSIELEKANNYIRLLEHCMDSTQALNQTLREDNEQLRNRLRVYE